MHVTNLYRGRASCRLEATVLSTGAAAAQLQLILEEKCRKRSPKSGFICNISTFKS